MQQFETRTFGDVTLVRGDCLNVMPFIAPKSVQMICADLPFGCTRNVWDQRIANKPFFGAGTKCGTANAAFVLLADMAFASHLIHHNRSLYRYDIVWEKKGRPSGHLNAGRQPLRSHEHILIFGKKGCLYNPQMTDGLPYKSRNKVGPHDGGGNYGAFVKKPNPSAGPRFPRSIISFNRVERPLHPTQKPVALLEWLIRTYTNDGDTILDPVAGSATTAIAAMNVGNRKVICIEKDPTYFEVMTKRVSEHFAKMEAARGAV